MDAVSETFYTLGTTLMYGACLGAIAYFFFV